MLWHAIKTRDEVVGNKGQEIYWQGSDESPPTRSNPPGGGPQHMAPYRRGAPMPVLQGGHCC